MKLELGSGSVSWPFWVIFSIAVVSLLTNIYLATAINRLAVSASAPVEADVVTSVVATHPNNGSQIAGINELRSLLLELSEGVNQNNEQLNLLGVGMTTQLTPEQIAQQAEWQERVKLARTKRQARQLERQFLHLEKNERAAAQHSLWLEENTFELEQTAEELILVEQSGVEALANYEARKKTD